MNNEREMDYSEITVEDIFEATILPYANAFSPAELWVEAENIFEVRKIVIEWYKALEDGSAYNRYPDKNNKSITMREAKRMIASLDKDFMQEAYRFEKLGAEAGPEFNRLPDYAKLAFAQQIKKVMKTEVQIVAEAKRRILAGEKLPKKPRSTLWD